MRLIDADKLKQFFMPISRTEYSDLKVVMKINDQPTACDIKQIRADIEHLHYHPKLDFIKNDDVVDMALEIIDKYIEK